MTRKPFVGWSLAALVVAFAWTVTIPTAARAAETKTLDNLMAAYNGESNAHAKYLKFAEQADKEGDGAVASLFRAAAKAEEIHAGNFAEVIKGMGGTPKADLKPVAVQSTRENLQVALSGETGETNSTYPAFIKQAKAEMNKDAMKAFNFAKAAESDHAKLFQDALDHLAQWKTGKTAFYVCPVCGSTTKGKPTYAECPACFTKAEKFLLVS